LRRFKDYILIILYIILIISRFYIESKQLAGALKLMIRKEFMKSTNRLYKPPDKANE